MSWAFTAVAAITAVSAFVSAQGQKAQAQAQSAMYDYEAAIAERNKIVAEQDRLQAIRTAQIEAEDKARENRRRLSSIRAAYGSSGLEMSGTPLEVLSDSAVEMALDERRIKYEGKVRGREGALRALGLQESAAMSNLSSENAKLTGRMAVAGTYAKAGASIATSAYGEFGGKSTTGKEGAKS